MALSTVLPHLNLTPFDYAVILGTSILAFFTYSYVQRRDARFRGLPYPPGPSGLPILGNLHQVNVLRPHPQVRSSALQRTISHVCATQFLEWAREYGPVFRVRLGPTQLIVLNTAEAADELLVNRGATYSGRPSPHVAFDIVSDGQRMVLMGYNHVWRVRLPPVPLHIA